MSRGTRDWPAIVDARAAQRLAIRGALEVVLGVAVLVLAAWAVTS